MDDGDGVVTSKLLRRLTLTAMSCVIFFCTGTVTVTAVILQLSNTDSITAFLIIIICCFKLSRINVLHVDGEEISATVKSGGTGYPT